MSLVSSDPNEGLLFASIWHPRSAFWCFFFAVVRTIFTCRCDSIDVFPAFRFVYDHDFDAGLLVLGMDWICIVLTVTSLTESARWKLYVFRQPSQFVAIGLFSLTRDAAADRYGFHKPMCRDNTFESKPTNHHLGRGASIRKICLRALVCKFSSLSLPTASAVLFRVCLQYWHKVTYLLLAMQFTQLKIPSNISNVTG